MSYNYYSARPRVRDEDRDTSKLPKWARNRLDMAERISKNNAEYWEKRVAEATEGLGPYTFKMGELIPGRLNKEIRVRLVDGHLEIMSSYGGALVIRPQVTNVIRIDVDDR